MEAPNIEIPRSDQKKYGINLGEYKYDEDITPELITPQLNDLLQKLNLTNQFKGSIGEKLLNNPNFFSFMNNYFFPAENFFNKEVYSNPILMRDYIMVLDELLINILKNPSQLDKINGDKIDLSKLVKYMCVIFFRKPDLLKKIKTFIQNSFNIKQLKTLEYVLQNTSNTEWDLSKQTSQQKKRASETQNMDTSKKQKIQTPNLKKRPRSKDDGVDSMETLMKKMDIGEEEKMLQEGGMERENGTTITNTNLAALLNQPNTLLNVMNLNNPHAVMQTGILGTIVPSHCFGLVNTDPTAARNIGRELSQEHGKPIINLTPEQQTILNQHYKTNYYNPAERYQSTINTLSAARDYEFAINQQQQGIRSPAVYINQANNQSLAYVPGQQNVVPGQEGGMETEGNNSNTTNNLAITDAQLTGNSPNLRVPPEVNVGQQNVGQQSVVPVQQNVGQQTVVPVQQNVGQQNVVPVGQTQFQTSSQTMTFQPSLIRAANEQLKHETKLLNNFLKENRKEIDALNDPDWIEKKSPLALEYFNFQYQVQELRAQVIQFKARTAKNRDEIDKLITARSNELLDAIKARRMIGWGYGVVSVLVSVSLGYIVHTSADLIKTVIDNILGPSLKTAGIFLNTTISQLNEALLYIRYFGQMPQDYVALDITDIDKVITQLVTGLSTISASLGAGAGILVFILTFLLLMLIYQLFIVNKVYRIGSVGWLPAFMAFWGVNQGEVNEDVKEKNFNKRILDLRLENSRIEDDNWQVVTASTELTYAREEAGKKFFNRIASRGFLEARAVNLITLFGYQDPALVDYQRVAGPGANPRVEEIEGGKKTRKKNRNLKKKKKSKKNKKTKRKISKKNKKSKKNKRSKKR